MCDSDQYPFNATWPFLDIFGLYLRELPQYFLALAICLNLDKWAYFMFRILAFVKIGRGFTDGSDDKSQDRKNLNTDN